MTAIKELQREIPTAQLCAALSVPRATVYRHLRVVPTPTPESAPDGQDKADPRHPRALSTEERTQALELLHGERFVDQSPAHIVATLLDEGRYVCSERSMYRLLSANGETRERRAIVRHGNFKKPELLATAPNQVWSWDITKLLGPEKWSYLYLYVILDIFSRYVVGWMVAERECGSHARALIEECLKKQSITEGQLTIHSDRGGPMKSRPVAFLMADLGVTRSFSRPQVSNDNPFSEAQFKTLKYAPGFPERFGCREDAIAHCGRFFTWYNGEHKHSGIGYYTPEDVHYLRAMELERLRNQTLAEAYAKNPERFVRRQPMAPSVPTAVWINPPSNTEELNKEDKISVSAS